MAEDWTYLDVRAPEEFALGHPAGAFNIPFELFTPEGLRENPAFLAAVRACFANARLIVGCKSGRRSARAVAALAEVHDGALVDQHAGWDGARGAFGEIVEPGWQRLDLPTESGSPAGRAWADLARLSGQECAR